MKRQIAVGTAQHPINPLLLHDVSPFFLSLSTCSSSFAVQFNFHTDPALSLSLCLSLFRFSFYFPAVIFSSFSLCSASLRLLLPLCFFSVSSVLPLRLRFINCITNWFHITCSMQRGGGQSEKTIAEVEARKLVKQYA